MMNNMEKKHFESILIKQADDVESTLGVMKDNSTADQDNFYPTELSNYDNHPAELGTELQTLEINNALRIHEENLLQEIRHAMDKLEAGRFGSCELCGRAIDQERLEAIPYTRFCMICQKGSEMDPQIRKRDRPVEELVIDAPMGRKYLNEREDDEYEGIDQFNDLMKYGSSDTPQDLGGYHDYDEFYTNEVDKQGIVDTMDQVTNDEYRRQLPD